MQWAGTERCGLDTDGSYEDIAGQWCGEVTDYVFTVGCDCFAAEMADKFAVDRFFADFDI
jgi:hypothetical protein